MQANFSPLRVIALNCAEEETQKLKEEQHRIKAEEGDKRVFVQPDAASSDSDNESVMSSAEESLNERIQEIELKEQEKQAESKTGQAHQRLKRAFLKPKNMIKHVMHPK